MVPMTGPAEADHVTYPPYTYSCQYWATTTGQTCDRHVNDDGQPFQTRRGADSMRFSCESYVNAVPGRSKCRLYSRCRKFWRKPPLI